MYSTNRSRTARQGRHAQKRSDDEEMMEEEETNDLPEDDGDVECERNGENTFISHKLP